MYIQNTSMLAVSRAGRDRDALYLILREEEGVCLLVNGDTRTINCPKKKKSIHLQKIIHLSADIRQKMDTLENDSDIRTLLAMYQQR